MASFADLEQKIGQFAARLKAFQEARDQRAKLALTMLANIEHKVRTQRSALEKANARIAELEKERDAAIARVSEIVDIYEKSLTNHDTFFRGIESLASKLLEPSASKTGSPPSPTLVERSANARPATGAGPVQAPSRTPFLKEMGPSQVQPRDRPRDGNTTNRPKS